MAVDVNYVGTVLLSAGADDQVRQGHPVLPGAGKVPLGTLGGGQGRVVDAEIAIGVEVLLQGEEVVGRAGAVENLHPRDRAHAELSAVDQGGTAAQPRRLVEQDQRHARSPTSPSPSTSRAARRSPSRWRSRRAF